MQMFEALDSDTSKLVVLYLQRVGDATPDRIAERLQLPLMTVLATVRYLDEEWLIPRLDGSARVGLDDDAEGNAPRLDAVDRTNRASPTG
jgi:predicted ArsR family transcriptional regulator